MYTRNASQNVNKNRTEFTRRGEREGERESGEYGLAKIGAIEIICGWDLVAYENHCPKSV